jgi:hypothetical protein
MQWQNIFIESILSNITSHCHVQIEKLSFTLEWTIDNDRTCSYFRWYVLHSMAATVISITTSNFAQHSSLFISCSSFAQFSHRKTSMHNMYTCLFYSYYSIMLQSLGTMHFLAHVFIMLINMFNSSSFHSIFKQKINSIHRHYSYVDGLRDLISLIVHVNHRERAFRMMFTVELWFFIYHG